MNRTTFGYVIMTFGSVAVVWAIIQFGKSHVKAPPDWSGTWWVLEPSAQAKTARFNQSGLYLHLKVGDQPARAYYLDRTPEGDFLRHNGHRQLPVFTRFDNGDMLVLPGCEGTTTLKLWRDAKARTAVERDGTAN